MTTKHKRWKVWRDRTMEAHGDDPWVGAPERNWQYRSAKYSFPTHAEALAYADRMARTVENVLPRVTGACDPIPNSPKPPEYSIWYGSRRDGAYWLDTPHGTGAPLIVGQEELVPLALALLALHYRSTAP